MENFPINRQHDESILDLKKALPLINPGASDEHSELFSRFTDESGGSGPNCLIAKFIGKSETGSRFEI